MLRLSRTQWAVLVVGLALLAGYMVVFSWTMQTQSYNTWGAFILFPVLVAMNAGLIWRAHRVERDPYVTGLLIVALVAKSAGALFRYYSVFFLYGGAADAKRYNDVAAMFYTSWRQGNFLSKNYEPGAGGEGTQAMELITTALYTVIGPSPLMGFFAFGTFAFWGTYLIFRAFRTAVPEGNHRRCALLLFLLPSLLYWPSSIGKESWLLFFVGVFALGAAKFFSGNLFGLAWLAVGVGGIALIRPHIAVLMMAAAALAQVLRPTDRSPFSIAAKAVGVAVMIVGVGYLAVSAADFLGIGELSTQGVTERIETAAGQTEQGGSAFEPVPLGSPLGVPAAIVTLLFRPFPWEAANAQMLLQSVEGLLLIVLTIRAWPQLRALPGLLRTNAYLTFCVAYTAGFILAFSGFANFGIVARQRVLMLPLFLVLLALPPVVRHAKDKVSRQYQEQSYVSS